MKDCFICNKHAGNIETAGVMIYEDEYVYVGHIDRNVRPNYLGHIMIDLKRHVPTLAELTVEEAKAFGVIMARVRKCRAYLFTRFGELCATSSYAPSCSLPEYTKRTLGTNGGLRLGRCTYGRQL